VKNILKMTVRKRMYLKQYAIVELKLVVRYKDKY